LNSNDVSNRKSDRLATLSWGERLGYGVGDAGFNFYWALIGGYLAAFYTDTLGLSAAVAAGVIFWAKIVDAFTDPIMGAVADRTNTRWGKFRPYLVWGAIPMGISAALAFTAPDISESGKITWAFVTYCLMMLFYTVLSTPYSSLSGVITGNVKERNLLVSIRFIFAYGASIVISFFTPYLIKALAGEGGDAQGWQLAVAIYGAIATVIFLITFATTKERVAPPPTQKSNPFRDLADLFKNRAWLILFVLASILMVTFTLRGGSAYYFVKYYLGQEDLWGWYLGLQQLALFAGAVMASFLIKRYDKKRLLIVTMLIVFGLSTLYFFIPKEHVWALFVMNMLISLALGPKAALTWSMYADVADYNEWKNGVRATGMTFSATTFSQKLGSAAGSVAMLGLLSYLGYEANSAQSDASLQGINFLQTALPGIFALVAAVIAVFYNLSSNKLEQIQAELAERAEG